VDEEHVARLDVLGPSEMRIDDQVLTLECFEDDDSVVCPTRERAGGTTHLRTFGSHYVLLRRPPTIAAAP